MAVIREDRQRTVSVLLRCSMVRSLSQLYSRPQRQAIQMTHEFRRRNVQFASPSALFKLSYLEWGDSENERVLICVHGLTRCARDFDALARSLADHYRVVSPDIPGRGESDWLKNPMEYATPTYVNAVVTLIARLGVETVDWVGTSMGGLIGMALASLEHTPIKRMVLNEAGPLVTAVSLERIGSYVGKAPRFPDLATAVRYVRTVAAPFGPHSDDEWRFLTEHCMRQEPDGSWRVHYDPAIAIPFNATKPQKDVELWPTWEAIRCPTFVLRGELSDLLTRETVERMKTTGPRAQVIEFAGIGHAPTLLHEDQIRVVRDFLLTG
jgi:pimeloyl-ACP methyl ester carboxylesterase